MKSIIYSLLATALFFGLAAQARNLDEARAISAQIEQVTGGKIKVLSDQANDDMYSDPTVIQNLNTVLSMVLHSSDLSTKSPEEIGLIVINSLGLVTQYSQQERDANQNLLINATDAENRFCRLADKTCNLFSQQISSTICNSQSNAPTDLLK